MNLTYLSLAIIISHGFCFFPRINRLFPVFILVWVRQCRNSAEVQKDCCRDESTKNSNNRVWKWAHAGKIGHATVTSAISICPCFDQSFTLSISHYYIIDFRISGVMNIATLTLPILCAIGLWYIERNAEAASLNTKVKVPDNDVTLNQLIDRAALPRANSDLQDSVLWVPASNHYNAIRISTSNGPKTVHSNYGFQLLLQRSRCSSSVWISLLISIKLIISEFNSARSNTKEVFPRQLEVWEEIVQCESCLE